MGKAKSQKQDSGFRKQEQGNKIMRVHEFAKVAGVANEVVVGELNRIRSSTDASHMSNISDEEQAVLVEKFPPANPAQSGQSSEVAEVPAAPPANPVILKRFVVSAFGLNPIEVDADDESEAIRRYVVQTGIADTAKYNFRVSPVA